MTSSTLISPSSELQQSSPAHQETVKIVMQVLTDLYRQQPDWVDFWRTAYGVDGVLMKAFGTPEAVSQFRETEEGQQIVKMLDNLRTMSKKRRGAVEPTRVITVRLPKSMHDELKQEAHYHQISMNKMCVRKLMEAYDADRYSEGKDGDGE